MPRQKGTKSSASTATRKKHARKAAKGDEDADQATQQHARKPQRGQKKLSKAQRKALPKIKQYIPPPKPPAPPIPDPLDGQGLARTLPAELVVVLRRLGKKDDVTRRKGLDELKEQYLTPLLQSPTSEDEEIQHELTAVAMEAAIPVWLHNLASLLQSPSHRTQALQLQTEMCSIPALRGVIIDSLSQSYLPGTQGRDILGSLLVASLEDGRRGSATAFKMWEEIVCFGPVPAAEDSDDATPYTKQLDIVPLLPDLAEYLSLSILDPDTLHRDIHPQPVQSAFNPQKTKEPAKGKGAKGKPATPIPTPTPPVEESSELAEERSVRYRVGGLVGLSWLLSKLAGAGMSLPEGLAQLLYNPVLWSALGTTSHLADLTPIGQEPPVRRAAYALLMTFVETYPAEVEAPGQLQLLSATVLGNCWSEQSAAVWESAGRAIVKFLVKYPQSWSLAAAVGDADNDDDEGDDDDDDDEDEDDEDDDEDGDNGGRTRTPSRPSSGSATPAHVSTSKAFNAFLDFISTICPSVPHLTYPLLVVVISTLPSPFLPLASPPSLPLQNLFSHLWSPVDARLLSTLALGGQPSAFQVFLKAAIDITTYLTEKAHANGDKEVAAWLVKEQLGARAWVEGVIVHGAKGGRRGAPPVETEAGLYATGVTRIATLSSDLTSTLMTEIDRTTVTACASSETSFLPRALNVLSSVRTGSASIEPVIDGTIVKVAESCIERLFQHLSESAKADATIESQALVNILRSRPDLFPSERVEALSQGLQAHMMDIVSNLSPPVTAALLDAVAAVSSESEKSALLAALWTYVEGGEEQSARFSLAQGMIDSDARGLFAEGSLDAIGVTASRAALSEDDATGLAIASKAVVSRDWLSTEARSSILTPVCDVVHDAVDGLLTGGIDAALPSSALSILAAYAEGNMSSLIASDEHVQGVVAAHHLVVLLPRIEHEFVPPASATKIWAAAGKISSEEKVKLSSTISRSLTELLGRVTCRADPETLVDVALATDLGQPATPANVAETLLPPSSELLEQLERHTSQPPHPTLPVIDALVPCVTDSEEVDSRPSAFDSEGRSKAARYAEAALALLRADKSLVQSFPSLLHVALAAMLLAQDGAAIPGASRGLYNRETPSTHLEQVVRVAEVALSFSLSLVDEAPLVWHQETVDQLRAGQASENADYLQRLLSDIRADVATQTSDVAPRAFREVLSRHLSKCGAGEAEGEVWLNYAMAMSEKLPDIALAVILAIKPFMLDAKPFDTAQNRLANALTGVSVRAANDKGLPALRLLVASAPPNDSASLFIPQQRAVFALRHVGGWLTSEDEAAADLADEIDVRVAELYTALAPIVQDLSGAHWDAIFDLISGALGSTSLDDPESYPLLYAALSLLREVRDLCRSNKALRALWVQKDEHLALVVTLFLQARDADSEPLQLIHTSILDLLTDASESVMAAAGFAELCALLRLSSSASVQSTAYRLLSQVIKSRTMALVLEVEAAVADEPNTPPKEIKLPAELVEILESGRDVDWQAEDDPPVQVVEAQLLAWMAVMDHFDDASRTLRWAYLDQLNSSRLLEEALLPFLFAMLGVSEVGAWNFPASHYAVDEFYCDDLMPESLPDLVPLGSHLLYRALVTIPSAMRTYYESLKDRQLSLSLLAFVSRHYSPVIIQHEFSALREPKAMAALTEEGLNVRIAQGGGATIAGAGAAEAIASYVVDEQPMEIGIRLPAEFPLKAVDVRDLRRVGVPENKWRGWLMSVQQTITSRNGLILEALTVFKKNVVLHFEGVVECAICYSIISVTDRSLPTKPCRTCKNRFHASCLFKWFNSSHSSSCPMCRSLF